MDKHVSHLKGFTLIELLISIAILGIIIALALPSFYNLITAKNLNSTAETLYQNLGSAQERALATKSSISVNIQPGTSTWCYGISDSGNCNCSQSGSCTVNGTVNVINSVNNPNISMTTNNFSGSYIIFEGNRGTVNTTGTISFSVTSQNQTITLSINDMGHMTICSTNITGYPGC